MSVRAFAHHDDQAPAITRIVDTRIGSGGLDMDSDAKLAVLRGDGKLRRARQRSILIILVAPVRTPNFAPVHAALQLLSVISAPLPGSDLI